MSRSTLSREHDAASAALRKLVTSALFLGLALVTKILPFRLEIPLFGENGMRVGIGGIFSMMPAILFGPVYGALTSGLSDLLGYVIRPTGAFLPQMTLVVTLGGLLRGLIWFFLKEKKEFPSRVAIAVLTLLLATFGALNIDALFTDNVTNQFYEQVYVENLETGERAPIGGEKPAENRFIIQDVKTGEWMPFDEYISTLRLSSRLVLERTMQDKDPGKNLPGYIIAATVAPLGIAGIGLVLLLTDFIVTKKIRFSGGKLSVLHMLIALLVSGLVVSTLNTFILLDVYASWKAIPLVFIWLPRTIQEIVANTVFVCFLAFIYGLFMKHPELRRLVGIRPPKKQKKEDDKSMVQGVQ